MKEVNPNILKKYQICLVLKDGYELPVYQGVNKELTMPEILAASSLISKHFDVESVRLKITEYEHTGREYKMLEEHHTDIYCY